MTIKVDAVAAGGVDEALIAVLSEAGEGQVGDHVGVYAEAERQVTHIFECLHPGYRGWHWAVTVSRAPRARTVTVDDVVLLPGDDALLAPRWVPWAERIAPGDVGPGMRMATPPEDPRLVPGYTAGAESRTVEESFEIRTVVRELGLGRARILSKEGRDSTCERWLSLRGPDASEARLAPAPCSTCGYFLRLRGELGAVFGACTNAFAGSDAMIVSIDYGCGAHSDVVEEHRGIHLPPLVWDDSDHIGSDELSLFD
ncbi:MAG: DUF3027 domain-containing protein [Propionibacteriaceae bacterium]|jgi:hypothetical protein|nr:DUF3027 domain-containing protein [Propionibacteriaceae bacterium]